MSSLQSCELPRGVVEATPAESALRHRKQEIRNYYITPFYQIIYPGKMANFGAPGGFIKVTKWGKKESSCNKIKHTNFTCSATV